MNESDENLLMGLGIGTWWLIGLGLMVLGIKFAYEVGGIVLVIVGFLFAPLGGVLGILGALDYLGMI